MKYLLGIDFGGGSSKATLLADDGKIVADSSLEYPTLYPKTGWTEQNPDDWFNAACENIKNILNKSGINSADISAISLDAATHTAVIMDENFNVLRPSIYWTDTRSTQEVEYLKKNYLDIIKSQVLHNPDTIWTLPELLWVKNNEPEIWGKVQKIVFAKDYVRHKLTGDYVTDFIEAEGSMMFDFNTMDWSKELCDILEIDTAMLPRLVKPTDIAGTITKEASEITGLAEGTPVLCGTTDTVMEVFASGAIKEGQMTLKLATAGRICVVTDKPYPDTNIINYSHVIDGLYYPGTATKSCAASYRWYRDTFGGDYKELDNGASKISVGSDGLVFHPYLNGELTPYANPRLCADFIGVRASHTKAHFTRAVLEGVAMSMLDCCTALDELGIPHDKEAVIIGGGGKSPLWRQIVSDALGMTFIEKRYSDSSLGSAMLAGVAIGTFESPAAAVELCNETISRTVPNPRNTEKYDEVYKKYKAAQKAMEIIYNDEDFSVC